MTDLLARAAELVDIPSVSLDEGAIADHVEAAYRSVNGLSVHRIENNVVARTELGRHTRVLLVGHSDTVPAAGNARARVDGDTLWGVGAADMKGALAIMLTLAEDVPEPAVDVTHVVYAAEEIAAEHNGLGRLFEVAADLLAGDVAIVGEPTDNAIEAGCQGTLRAELRLAGEAAHSARPWMGVNAIHRLGGVLERLAAYEARRPVIGGCEFREALQAVGVAGGVAGNVVPPAAELTINHRFAPDRSVDDAFGWLRELLADLIGEDDELALVDAAPGAVPATNHPAIRSMIAEGGLDVRAKLGWTDVARLSAHGIPAVNFGPGDSTLAHRADERVERRQLVANHAALVGLLDG